MIKTLVKGKNGFNIYTDLPTIVAVDFDGTLYSWDGKYKKDLIDGLVSLQKDGIQVVLWTCRPLLKFPHLLRGLVLNGLIPDGINSNHPLQIEAYGDDGRKIFAHFYLDDASLGYDSEKVVSQLCYIKEYNNVRFARGDIGVTRGTEKRDLERLLKDFHIEPNEDVIEKLLDMSECERQRKVRKMILEVLGDD